MADKKATHHGGGGRRQSSRLQRQAPASIQISPVSDWNVAIPLLSPLVTASESEDWTRVQIKSSSSSSSSSSSVPHQTKDQEKQPTTTVFKKWQHPASPFCYEPAPPHHLVPFVCTAADKRS